MGRRPEGPGSIPPRMLSKTPQTTYLGPRSSTSRFLVTDENLTCGARTGLAFLVHRKSEGRRAQGGISAVVGGAARGWKGGGTRFDSRLAQSVASPQKLREKFSLGGRFGMVWRSFWDGLGMVLGSFGDNCGSFWDQFGIALGSFRAHFFGGGEGESLLSADAGP